MSAFICNNKTINRILTFLNNPKGILGDLSYTKELFNKGGFDIENEAGLQNLGKAIKNLNCDAVAQRYNEKKDIEAVEEYTFKYEFTTLYQAFNHLRCLTYQCSEGNIPETKLYKLLEKLEQNLEYTIALENPEVKGAEWDARGE